MDEPWAIARHPPGPEFEKARREDEHKRQQRIAALGPDQKRAFDQLRRDQQGREKELEAAQRQRWRQDMAERMRQKVLADKAPHLRPDGHRRQLQDSQYLRHAIDDYLSGRSGRVAGAHRARLARAYRTSRREVAREQGKERGEMRQAHQRERDQFLSKAERERGGKGHDKAAEKTRDGAADRNKANAQQRDSRPDKPERDPAWQRAFDKAAHKEAAHEREMDRDHQHDYDKGR